MNNPAPGFETHPDHIVAITACDSRLEIMIDGQVIASTDKGLVLAEASYPAVYYLPSDTLPKEILLKSVHQTWCPFKGHASYYHLVHEGKTHQNAVWFYPEPFDEAIAIRNYLAIYPDVAEIVRVG